VIANFDHEQMILLVIKWSFMDHEQCSLHATGSVHDHVRDDHDHIGTLRKMLGIWHFAEKLQK
jgi:hypothetical protein